MVIITFVFSKEDEINISFLYLLQEICISTVTIFENLNLLLNIQQTCFYLFALCPCQHLHLISEILSIS